FYVWIELQPETYKRLGCDSNGDVSDLLAKIGIGSIPGETFGESNNSSIRFAYSCDTAMVEQGALLLRETLLGNQT
ncbi:MAG: hypothetical protein ACXAC2_12895, partial [Candidatus Kariarchaeaceae archaeon]